jgi:hypothetical protein
MDASVGSTAFLLRQLLGERTVRVSPELAADYDMDDPTAVDRLDGVAATFFANSMSAIPQTDGTRVDLARWLESNWF